MIESSDNDAAESLYQEVGTASGVMKFLNSHELSGIIPDPNTWGTESMASPQAMVDLFSALSAGELLSATGTAYALSLMQNVVPDQRFGVGDTAPHGSIVSMKNGWLLLDQGWAVNSSGIVQTPRITYILSVYTMRGASQEGSMRIIRTICPTDRHSFGVKLHYFFLVFLPYLIQSQESHLSRRTVIAGLVTIGGCKVRSLKIMEM